MQLIECVPNFSEGRNLSIIKQITDEIEECDGIRLLDVDLGADAHTLHSEGSYTPTCPEIIWFYCNIPTSKGGETTLCDGISLWNSLGSKAKAFFLANPLRFDLEISIGKARKGKERQIWISNTPGTSGYINWDSGTLVITQLQYATQNSRFGNLLCFSNHLLAELGKDTQIKNEAMLMSNREKVPEKFLNEIKIFMKI